jgi:flagellar biosynthetic protein FliQ
MTVEFAVHILRQALITVLTAGAPVLIVGMVVGLVVSIFQAVSQVHEITLTFIPKIIAIFIALMIFAPWIVKVLLNFTTDILTNLAQYAK